MQHRVRVRVSDSILTVGRYNVQRGRREGYAPYLPRTAQVRSLPRPRTRATITVHSRHIADRNIDRTGTIPATNHRTHRLCIQRGQCNMSGTGRAFRLTGRKIAQYSGSVQPRRPSAAISPIRCGVRRGGQSEASPLEPRVHTSTSQHSEQPHGRKGNTNAL